MKQVLNALQKALGTKSEATKVAAKVSKPEKVDETPKVETAKVEKAKETQPVVKKKLRQAQYNQFHIVHRVETLRQSEKHGPKSRLLSELRVKEKVIKLNLVRTVVTTVNKVRDVQTMSEMIAATIVVTSVQKSGKTTDLETVAIIETTVVRTIVQVGQLALSREGLQNQQDLKLTSKRVLLL